MENSETDKENKCTCKMYSNLYCVLQVTLSKMNNNTQNSATVLDNNKMIGSFTVTVVNG